jgi:hypothetical protein
VWALDSVSAKSSANSAFAAVVLLGPAARVTELSGLAIEELCAAARAKAVGLRSDELAALLITIGQKCNFGFRTFVIATPIRLAHSGGRCVWGIWRSHMPAPSDAKRHGSIL